MNREKFLAGMLMLFLPIILFGVFWLIEQDINWTSIGIFSIIIVYFGTAFWALIGGLAE